MADDTRSILTAYHMATLQEMALAADIEVTKGRSKLRKTELLTKMQAEFFTPARIQTAWKALSHREKAVLNRLLLHGGQIATRSLKREVLRAELATEAQETPKKRPAYHSYRGVSYDQEYTGSPHNKRSTIFEDIIARLTYRGLVFSRDDDLTTGGAPYKLRFHPANTLYVPEIIRAHLPEPEPVQLGLANWQPAYVQTAEPALLLRDLYLYWDFVRRNQVTLIQSGFVGKRHLKAINEQLLVPDPLTPEARREDDTDRLYLLRQLLESLNLIHKTSNQLRPAIDNDLHIPEFWDWDSVKQLNACLEAWSQLTGLQKLAGNPDRFNTRPLEARKAVLTALKTFPPQAWFEPDELLERVQGADINFFILDHSQVEAHRGGWYYNYKGAYFSGEKESLLKTFETLETAFVNNCLTGFLHALGIVELGYDTVPASAAGAPSTNGAPAVAPEPQTPDAFRLTTTGQALLGAGGDSHAPPHDSGKLIVQPNFHLMAIGPVSLKILAHLDLFAERKQADRGAFEYQVSRESVYQAQQLGFDVEAITQFLAETSGVDLPQNIRRSLEEWGSHHERIVFRTGVSLLQAADEALLARLQDHPATTKALARSLTPEIALIRKKSQSKLVSALLKQNLFPVIAGAQPEAADHSITLEKDGSIQPIHAVPSLHLRGRLARLAEEVEGQGWRLTPKSIRRAGGNRNKFLNLIDELQKLHRGPLPDGLVTQIQSWGGYYGQAAIETLTLVEFQDQTILDELAKQPDLAPYLTPFPAGNRALAVIPAGKLTEIKAILDRFGVRIKEGLAR